MTPTLTPATPVTTPSASDRCDRCGAQARVRVVLPGGGDLMFCGHHARAYDAKLRELSAQFETWETETDDLTS